MIDTKLVSRSRCMLTDDLLDVVNNNNGVDFKIVPCSIGSNREQLGGVD